MADEHTIKDCDDLDAHLTPFVDGEDAPADRRAVAQHLTACPPCRRHADDEASARRVIQDHRDDLRVTAPESLRRQCLSAAHRQSAILNRQSPIGNRKSTIAWLSLAATLVLAVAGVFVFGVSKPVEALAASLTLDHVKCFKVGDVEHSADAAAAEQRWQSDHGWPIAIPKGADAEQLTLVSVRHCLSSDGRTAHLMYNWRGKPLSLYVIPEDSGHTGDIKELGHEAVMWSANNRTYAVVADGGPRDLAHIVDYMKGRVR